ncbi:MAG: DMT family transporter [Planctomycetota bacterium]
MTIPSAAEPRDDGDARSSRVLLALLLVQVMFGSFPVVGKLALAGIEPRGLLAVRVGGAALIYAWLARRRGLFRVSGRDRLELALYCILGVLVNQFLFLEGLARTVALNASILVTTIPVWTVALAVALRRESLTWPKVCGLALAIAGAFYLVGIDEFDLSQEHAAGNAMVLLNGISYAVYLVLARNILRRLDPIVAAAWIFALASLVAVPAGAPLLLEAVRAAPWSTWLWCLYVLLVPTVAAYLLNMWALRHVEASTVAIFIAVQPLVSGLLDWLVFGFLPSGRAGIAGILIVGGVMLVNGRFGPGKGAEPRSLAEGARGGDAVHGPAMMEQTTLTARHDNVTG